MNKTVKFNALGGPEVLELVSEDIPTPAENEVVVHMKAAGLNRAEYLFFQGQYLFQPSFPSKLGIEGAGVITEVGSQVTNYQVGDEVCTMPNIDVTRYGHLAEYATVPAAALIKKPESLNFEQAAALWSPFATAYGSLVLKGGLTAGGNQTVLITAASSSVGIACIQMAKQHGAQVIATTRTASKKEFLLEAGADFVVVTDEENLVESVKKATGGAGFHIAVDAVTGPIVPELAEAAAPEAVMVLYGILNPEETPFPLFPILTKGINITGFHAVFHLLDIPERAQAMEQHIVEHVKCGTYQVAIDRTFELAEIAEAYRYLESNQQKGKIVVCIAA